MKKLFFLLLIILVTISCQKNNTNNSIDSFKGIGELIIGAKFDSIPSHKLFDKKNKNEYVLNKFELTKNIGIVENVNIKLNKGYIYSVSFTSGKFTNKSLIEECMVKNSIESEYSGISNDESYEGKTYESLNHQISISYFTLKDKNLIALQGFYATDYFYSDIKIENEYESKSKAKKDSIEKANYMKDVKQIK